MALSESDQTASISPTQRADGEDLPGSVIAAMSIGQGGMSVLINLLGLLLVFFYLPPDSAGLPTLVSGATYLVVLNAVVLLAAAGRLADAITDPLIAVLSDRCSHRRGRRIPFMAWGALPSALATFAMFMPPVGHESGWNIVWLLVVQFVLFVALTAYVTPAFSLVADLGHTPEERLDLATWTSVAWAVGILVAAMTPFLAAIFEGSMATLAAWQWAIGIVCAVALVAMVVPVVMIDEPRWARSQPASVPPRQMLSIITANPFFRYYAAADFAYFCGLMIIQTGLLYYVTVLLELDQALTAPLLLAMIVISTFLYPVVNRTAKKRSGKALVIFAFIVSGFDFLLIMFLGPQLPIPTLVQAFGVIAIFAVGFAVLSVLPQWILSDIAEHSTLSNGTATAASFFAARTFVNKISQTVGVMLFAVLTTFGRDIGDDLGIRLSGLGGMALYAAAAFIFRGYDEKTLKSELATMTGSGEAAETVEP